MANKFNLNNFEEVQLLFEQRSALTSRKYLEAEKQYQVWNNLLG